MSVKKIGKKIERLTIDNPATPNRLDWFNIVDAGKNELEFIKNRFGLTMEHIVASTAASQSERPRLLVSRDYIFLILHFPVLLGRRIKAAEIDCFIGHGYLVTLHNGNLPSLNHFFNLCKKEPSSLDAYHSDSSAILLAELLNELMNDCYHILDQNSHDSSRLETLLFKGNSQQTAVGILRLRHNIINLRKILQNHKHILQKLMELKSSIVPRQQITGRYGELVESSKRIWEALDNQKEMIEVINSTNQSLLNNRMTDIMKTLTIFSVIIFPLTLLATIFSMRADDLPLVNHPHGFWLILGLMTLVIIVMLIFFKRKKWL